MIKEFDLYIDEDQAPYLQKVREHACSKEYLNNPKVISSFLRKAFEMDKKAEEEVVVLSLNTKCKPLAVFSVFKGTINSSLISPREILIRAMLSGAAYIAVAHNHPSGELTPSKEDKLVSKRILEASNMLGIEMLDFLIIKNGYYSFKEEKLI